MAFQSPFVSGGGKAHDPGYEGWVDTVYLGCWKRHTLERLGLFNEAMVRAQDSELNFRIIRSGGRVWQTPRIQSFYEPRNSYRDLFRQYVQYGYWKVVTLGRHHRPASLRQLVPPIFLVSLALLASSAPWFTASRIGLVEIRANLFQDQLTPWTIVRLRVLTRTLCQRHREGFTRLTPIMTQQGSPSRLIAIERTASRGPAAKGEAKAKLKPRHVPIGDRPLEERTPVTCGTVNRLYDGGTTFLRTISRTLVTEHHRVRWCTHATITYGRS